MVKAMEKVSVEQMESGSEIPLATKDRTGIRVFVVDDDGVMRDGLCAVLSLNDGIEIIGAAADGEEAVNKAQELSPDVIVMDVALSGMTAFEVARRITKHAPRVKILMLTQHCDREHVTLSIKAGASGYVSKRASTSEVISAINAVYRGDSFLYPSVAATLIHEYMRCQSGEEKHELTSREREVLRMIAEGQTSRQIADRLVISHKTVTGHREKIMKKLAVHKQVDLVKYAIRAGLVVVDS